MSHMPGLFASRTLARGLAVCPVGIGCWAIGGPDTNLGLPMGWSTTDDTRSLRGLETAYQLGANLFDTADVYGHGRSERLLGHLIRQVPRDRLVISSKVGYFAGTAAHPYLPSALRRQLETTLENLHTDHLDIYFLHNSNFGANDQYLDGAIEQMRVFQEQGLIKAVGMRGPHRFATDRLTVAKQQREDKYARFHHLFARVRPDYLAVRFNALTPSSPRGHGDIFAFAADHGTSVLINKPLAQGLLTSKYDPAHPPRFGPGDHRLRKAWFTPQALRIIHDGLQPVRDRFGANPADLAPVMLAYCLHRASNAAVLVGFTTPEQVRQNLTPPARPLTSDDMAFIRDTVSTLQRRLDAAGEVFLDELPTAQP
jgi:methylglyoxal reductase